MRYSSVGGIAFVNGKRKKIEGKDENAGYSIELEQINPSQTTNFRLFQTESICRRQFQNFSQCFLINQIIIYPFVHIFDIISLLAAELEEPKIGL